MSMANIDLEKNIAGNSNLELEAGWPQNT